MWPFEMKGTKRNQKLKQPNHSPGLQGHTKRSREPALKQESIQFGPKYGFTSASGRAKTSSAAARTRRWSLVRMRVPSYSNNSGSRADESIRLGVLPAQQTEHAGQGSCIRLRSGEDAPYALCVHGMVQAVLYKIAERLPF